MLYRVPEGLQLQPFDSAQGAQLMLITAPDGRQWQMSLRAVDILICLRDTDSLDSAALALSATWHRIIDPATLGGLIEKSLVPSGLALLGDSPLVRSERAWGGSLSYMSLRLRFLSADVVGRLASPFEGLFSPTVFWPVFMVVVALYPWLIMAEHLASGVGIWDDFRITPGVFLWVFGSQLVHELGHAAAARRLGVRHGGMGFGVYIVYPVFFMELDDAWRISREERAIVDAAGVFFHLCFGVLFLLLALLIPSLRGLGFSVGVAMAVFSLYNLNPAFRTDGYWLVSDLLGVANLRRRSQDSLRHFAASLIGREVTGSSRVPTGLSSRMGAALIVFSIASTGYLSYALLAFGRAYFKRIVDYPASALHQLLYAKQSFAADQWVLAFAVLVRLIGPTVLALGGTLTLGILILQTTKAIASRVIRRSDVRSPSGVILPSGD